MKAFILICAIAVLSLTLGGCAEDGNSTKTSGQNVLPQCSGITLVAKYSQNPAQKFAGYVNNVLAFDECSGNANGYTFSRSNQPVNGLYEFVLSNGMFPYPVAGNTVNLRFDVRLTCGTPILQSASRSIPLEDRGGCYYATFTP